jgi:MFS family permease
MGDAPAPKTVFRDVFAIPEFRALWLAQILSVAGDQLARVALTVLVYDRTASPLLAAVTYAASFVPGFVGGVTLSSLADRYPRRAVMIACDLIRAAMVLVMAISGVPIAALVVLLCAVTLVGAPFTSARAAVYPDVLPGDRYVLGTAVTITTNQLAQVIGFAVGGTLVGLLGVGPSLVIDAGTFAASALIVRCWTRGRPAARPAGDVSTGDVPAGEAPAAVRPRAHQESRGRGLLVGTRLVFARPALRDPMLLGWLCAFYNAPEAIAAPLAQSLGGGSFTVGLILAAEPFGAMLGSLAFSRLVSPPRRLRWMGPLATAASAVLVLFVFHLGLLPVLLVLFAAGAFAAFQLAANAAFVAAAPPERRSEAFGLAQGGMSLGQGVFMVLAGAAVSLSPPHLVIAAFGAAGTVAALVILADRARTRVPARDATSPLPLGHGPTGDPGRTRDSSRGRDSGRTGDPGRTRNSSPTRDLGPARGSASAGDPGPARGPASTNGDSGRVRGCASGREPGSSRT